MSQPIPPAVQSTPVEGDFEQDLLALQPRLRRFLRKLLISLPTTVVEDLMQETYARALMGSTGSAP